MTEGGVFNFLSGAIVSVGVFILIVVATAVLPNEPVEKH
jgi:hypothetical protein